MPGLKLFIQIPCYNEAETLPETLAAIPRSFEGISKVQVLVIDDGSTDDTIRIAREQGADFVVPLRRHQGLARAFTKGVRHCLNLGADIIVNLDADNQYCATSITELIGPILDGRAEIVLGCRDFGVHSRLSPSRRRLQLFGSLVMSKFCRASIPDAATGFRAFSRGVAVRLHIFTKYTYTLEMLIHAAHHGEKVISVPIRTNPSTRASRLFRHPLSYLARNMGALIRLTFLYNPLRMLGWVSAFTAAGALFGFCLGAPLIILIGLAGSACFAFFTGLVLDQISVNRKLLEDLHSQLFELGQRQTGEIERVQLAPGLSRTEVMSNIADLAPRSVETLG